MAQAPRNGAIPDYVEVLAGQDGTATRALKTDAAGELQVDVLTMPTSTPPTGASATQVQGTAAAAAAPVGNPVQVGGTDGTNMRTLKTDTAGVLHTIIDSAPAAGPSAVAVQGNAAEGGSPTANGNPFMVSGSDGVIRTLRLVGANKPGQATALANGSTADIWTPATGKKFRLLGLAVGASAAGRYALVEGAGNDLVLPLRLPANQSIPLAVQANGILSAAANNVLKLRNDSGGAADLDWCAWGMEE